MDLSQAERAFGDLDDALARLPFTQGDLQRLARAPRDLLARALNTPHHEEAALLFAAMMLAPQPSTSRDALYHAWWELFPRAKATPHLRAAAILLLDYGGADDLFWPGAATWLDRVHRALGGLMAPLAAAALLHRELQRAAALHLWLMGQPGDWSQLHLHLLRHGRGKVLREQALVALSRDPNQREPLREALEALLRAPRADDRALAAQGLARLADRRAQRALQAALDVEKALAPRKAIQGALQAFDPVARALARATQPDEGFYTLGAPLDPNDGLSALRALAHEPPALQQWTKICNYIERLRASDTHLIAADYLRDPLARWPEALRPRPYGWEKEPALAALAPSNKGPLWLPVEALLHPKAVRAALFRLEGLAQVRRLGEEGVARFVHCLRQCWAWCEARQLAPDTLELCLDAAQVQNGAVSYLELWGSFGAAFQRRGGYVYMTQPGPLLVRAAKVRVPPGHPAREALLMSHRQRVYSLTELLAAPGPAGSP